MESILMPAFVAFSAAGIIFGIVSIVRRIPKIFYANILSGMNAACGLLSILASAHYHNLIWAVVFVRMGEAFDFFDGRAARKHGSTERGGWIDDAADLVSFGLAPGMILLQFGGRYAWFYAFIYVACVAGRLARFTLFDSQREDLPEKVFNGLPSPAGSDIVTSICLISIDDHVLFFAAVISSLLMVSHIRFAHFGLIASEYVRSGTKKRSLRVIGAVVVIMALGYLTRMKEASLFGWFFLSLAILYMAFGALAAIRAKRNHLQAAESA